MLLTPQLALAQSGPKIEFAVTYNAGVYSVWMKPTGVTSNTTLTSQVTLVVPHNATSPFIVNNLSNLVSGTVWALSGRDDAPTQNPTKDYVSFYVTFTSGNNVYNWTAGQPIKVFTFTNDGSCTGAVELMDNANDPYWQQGPNNHGNQVDVLGLGDLYAGRYNVGSADCTKSDLTITIGQPSPSFKDGITSNVPVTVTNVGGAPSGPVTVTVPLPTGITSPASFNPAPGWSCTSTTTMVTCTNPGPINPGMSSPFSIPMTPGPSAVGTTPTLNATVNSPNDNNPANNNAPPVTTGPVAGSPDLVTTIGSPSPSLKDGITSTIPVTVANIGTGPTTGPITTTVPLQAGLQAPASFTSNGWTCTTTGAVATGQTVTCTNPGPINPGTNKTFNVPVKPTTTTPPPAPPTPPCTLTNGDKDTSNNCAPQQPIIPVAGSPNLTTTIGSPSPSLKDGITSTIPVTVANIGSGPTTGPITTTVPLQAGLQAPASFTSNGWTCTTTGAVATGQTVTCTNPGPINPGTNKTFNVPVKPTTTTPPPAPPTPPCTLTNGDSNSADNCAPQQPIIPVAGSPDLTIALGQPTPNLAEGVTSSLPVTVSNIGSGPTTSPVTVSVPLPPGVTAPASFNPGNGWSCTTTGSNVTCTNPGPLNPNTNSPFSIPITPTTAAVGTTPVFNASVSTPGDKDNSNNNAAPVTGNTVLGTPVILPIKVFLGGAYNSSTGLMRDDLRSLNLIPTKEPYTGMTGFTPVNGGGGETANASVFSVTGNNAIVDWVVVELRSMTNNTTVVATRAALVQRDGDVVGVDGVLPLTLPYSFNNQTYFIAIRHRNHLGALTSNAVTLTPSTAVVDFTSSSTQIYGTYPEKMVGSVLVLWSGNVLADKRVIEAGPSNDVNGVFNRVLGSSSNTNLNANYIVNGYFNSDVNMDGKTIAAGPNNDVNPILANVLTHPANTNAAANYIVLEQDPAQHN